MEKQTIDTQIIDPQKPIEKGHIFSYSDIEEKLQQYSKYINFNTELLPYLDDSFKIVFKKYMIAKNRISARKFAKSLGKSPNYMRETIMSIYSKIEYIIQRKAEIKEFYKRAGGKNGLEDIKLFLDDKDKIVLDNCFLSKDPNARIKCAKLLNISSQKIHFAIRKASNMIEYVIRKRQETEKFINDNGGEDFLINEFSYTLSDVEFDVLIYRLMDYHYFSKSDINRQLGLSDGVADYHEQQIKDRLEKYQERKKSIDNLIILSGGIDNVIDRIYNTSDDLHKYVFEQHTIAYAPLSLTEMAENLNTDYNTISEIAKNLDTSLNDLAVSNSPKHNKNLTQ